MRGLARRLDDEAPEIETRGQLSRRDLAFQQRRNTRLEILKKFMNPLAILKARANNVLASFAPALAKEMENGFTALKTVRDARAALSQVRVGVKKTAIFAERKSVGHPGDIVRGGAGALPLARPRRPFPRHRLWPRQIRREQPTNDRVGLFADALDLGMPIHTREQEPLDVAVGCFDFGRKADQRPARFSSVASARDPGVGDPAARFRYDVLDEARDDAPRELVDRARSSDSDARVRFRPPARRQRDEPDIVQAEQARAQAVVDVVRVIGDVVGDRGRLRLEARESMEFERWRLT